MSVMVEARPARGSLGFVGLAVRRGLIAIPVLALPFVAQRYQLGLVTNAMILALGAIALNALMGLAGLVSAGNAALFAVGAFGAAFCALQLGLPFAVTLVICIALGALIGFVVGLPALRVQGIYLAIATLALHYVVIFILNRYQADTVGPMGFVLPPAEIFGYRIVTATQWYYLTLVFLAACFLGFNNLKRSHIGRTWMLLRDAPIAAASQGIHGARYKLLAFVLSSAVIGFSGGYYAYYLSNVYIEAFTLELAIQYIAMIVIGGWGSAGGAIAGAFFVSLMPTFLSTVIAMLPRGSFAADFLSRNVGDVQLIVYGGLIIGFLVLEPTGLAGLKKRLDRRFFPEKRR